MGILKVIQNTNSSDDYLYNSINYIENKSDTVGIGGYRTDPYYAYQQMMTVKNYFAKTSGNQLMHFVVSFNKRVADIETALDYAYKIAMYYGNRFQTVFAVHEKDGFYKGKIKSYYHVHFILNSVSYVDGRMFAQSKGELYHFMKHIEKVTRDSNFKIIYGSECEGTGKAVLKHYW